MTTTTEPTRLAPGDTAPDFSLLDQSGNTVSLKDFAGRRVLLFFYPKANTPGCTNQACGLRDVVDEIGDTAILGMSPDTPEKQASWDDKHSLGYPLLSDPEHVTADAYGVWGEKKMYGNTYMGIIRSSFLIDANGKIEQAWYKISPKDTPKKLLAALN